MSDFITYSLRGDQDSSDRFYSDLAIFTDEVLEYAEMLTGHLVGDYQSYVRATGLEKPRSREEYSFELLVMGVFWRTCGKNAQRASAISKRLLRGLVRLRTSSSRLKPFADLVRGILGTACLVRESKERKANTVPHVKDIGKLLEWMEAAGEFSQETKRLRNWKAFFDALPGDKAEKYPEAAASFAEWFEAQAKTRLGYYTGNVERYLGGGYLKHRWKEDVVFCGQGELEYHLNMVGAEIMNRAFREEFLQARKRVVLLPACMRAQPESACRAVHTDSGLRCSGCTKGCGVNKLTEMGKTSDFEVYIVHHESSAFKRWMTKPAKDGEIGIIGVVCVLNLISGGWKAKDLDIPPQCVFLDYCGCSNHWDEKGIVTDININQLKRILGTRNEIPV